MSKDEGISASPSSASLALRRFFLFGLPLLAGIGGYVVWSSIVMGVLALIVTLVLVIAVALRFAPASSKPGTRAWEAAHNAQILADTITGLSRQLATTKDPQQRARLQREIAFFDAQLAEEYLLAESNDRSPGRGYVGITPYSGG